MPSLSPQRHCSGSSELNFRSGCFTTSQVLSRERVEERVPKRCRPAGLAPTHLSAAPELSLSTQGSMRGGPVRKQDAALSPTGRVSRGPRGGRLGQGTPRLGEETKTRRASKRQPGAGSTGCSQTPNTAGFTELTHEEVPWVSYKGVFLIS